MWMRSITLVALAGTALWGEGAKYGIGRTPTPEQVKAWDISIGPDGAGLPEGSGTAVEGQEVYQRRCERCHGANAAGGDEAPLAGGQGSLATPKPLKTVGSYWPYATTLWDYTNRAMPFKNPGMLTPSQVYAVVAYILHRNGIIGEKDVMNAKTLPQVRMPNRDGFIPDPRGARPKRKSGRKL
jgi:cytochrome c